MIQIRPATLEDFEQLQILFRQLWPKKDIVPDRLNDVYGRVIATQDKRYFCAVSGEKVIALGSVAFKDNLWQEGVIAYVEELVVHEDWRGQGIGSRLLEHLTELAREKGCRRIELDSAFHRVEAHKLYERHGLQKRAFLFSRVLDDLSSTRR